MSCGTMSMVDRFTQLQKTDPERAEIFVQQLNDTFETVYPGKQDAGFYFESIREDSEGVYATYTDGENTQELKFMSKGCGGCKGCG